MQLFLCQPSWALTRYFPAFLGKLLHLYVAAVESYNNNNNLICNVSSASFTDAEAFIDSNTNFKTQYL